MVTEINSNDTKQQNKWLSFSEAINASISCSNNIFNNNEFVRELDPKLEINVTINLLSLIKYIAKILRNKTSEYVNAFGHDFMSEFLLNVKNNEIELRKKELVLSVAKIDLEVEIHSFKGIMTAFGNKLDDIPESIRSSIIELLNINIHNEILNPSEKHSNEILDILSIDNKIEENTSMIYNIDHVINAFQNVQQKKEECLNAYTEWQEQLLLYHQKLFIIYLWTVHNTKNVFLIDLLEHIKKEVVYPRSFEKIYLSPSFVAKITNNISDPSWKSKVIEEKIKGKSKSSFSRFLDKNKILNLQLNMDMEKKKNSSMSQNYSMSVSVAPANYRYFDKNEMKFHILCLESTNVIENIKHKRQHLLSIVNVLTKRNTIYQNIIAKKLSLLKTYKQRYLKNEISFNTLMDCVKNTIHELKDIISINLEIERLCFEHMLSYQKPEIKVIEIINK